MTADAMRHDLRRTALHVPICAKAVRTCVGGSAALADACRGRGLLHYMCFPRLHSALCHNCYRLVDAHATLFTSILLDPYAALFTLSLLDPHAALMHECLQPVERLSGRE